MKSTAWLPTARRVGLLSFMTALAACQSDREGGLSAPSMPAEAVGTSGSSIVIDAGRIIHFSAPAEGEALWSVASAEDAGAEAAIDAQGTFRADQPGRYLVFVRQNGSTQAVRVTARRSTASNSADTSIAFPERSSGMMSLVSDFRVEVSPSTVTMQPGERQAFAGVGVDGSGTRWTIRSEWSVASGAIDTSGAYTAPSGAGTYHVVLKRYGDDIADTALVTVGSESASSPGSPSVGDFRIEVSPDSVSLAPGRTTRLSAVGVGGGTSYSVRVNWRATGGVVSAEGDYTAPSSAGRYSVIATRDGDSLADTSIVVVTSGGVTADPAPAPAPEPTPTPPAAPTDPVASAGRCGAYAAAVLPAPLRTFYVDASTGNDANAGTSASAPWRTLSKAGTAAQAGDLVYLRGTFSNQWLAPANSGTATAPIVFQVWPGATAIMSGGLYDVEVLLESGRAYIVVDGLELTNVTNPFMIRYGAHHNTLRNLKVHDAGGSLIVQATDNRVEDSRFERIGSEASNGGDAIFLAQGANRNTLVRNRFLSAGHGAIWISYWSASDATNDDNVVAYNDIANPWASGLGLNGTANRTLVECNTIHHTANGSGPNYARDGIEIEGTANVVRYNTIYSAGATGLSLQGRSFASRVQNARDNQIYNNTFWGNGAASLVLVQRDVGVVQNNLIQNNVFWQDAGSADGTTRYAIWVDQYNANAGNVWSATSVGGNVVRNNVFPTGQSAYLLIRNGSNGGNVAYGSLSQLQAALAGWTGNRQQDPLLSNPGAGDFRLQSSSPAIDAGLVVSGQSYLGGAPDLGANELR